MNDEKQILNELGDTLRGKQALGRYLTARMDSMKKLNQEAQRMKDVGSAHIKNTELYGKPPSRKVALAYADMVANLFRRTARYKTGMDRAAARIMAPIKEDNSMTIKEHYKDILNERLFNKYNILGKIEDTVKSVGGKALDALTGHSKSPYNKEGRVKYTRQQATEQGRRRAAAADVRRIGWENRKGIKESSLLNEIGDTARGQGMLRRYIKKAANSLRHHASSANFDVYAKGDTEDPKHNLKASNRQRGIENAVNRLSESDLLNEIGDTARGQAALRSYIGARSRGIDSLDRELKHIDMAIRQTTDRLRNPTTHTDLARQRGMQ